VKLRRKRRVWVRVLLPASMQANQAWSMRCADDELTSARRFRTLSIVD
jgi:hypothetical protein